MKVLTKRVYDPPAGDDGFRVLVDRLWPRGETHEKARVDRWLKEIAPSKNLRTWWNHDSERMSEFAARYTSELNENNEAVGELLEILDAHPTVTLLYAARDAAVNHAIILQRYMDRLRGSDWS